MGLLLDTQAWVHNGTAIDRIEKEWESVLERFSRTAQGHCFAYNAMRSHLKTLMVTARIPGVPFVIVKEGLLSIVRELTTIPDTYFKFVVSGEYSLIPASLKARLGNPRREVKTNGKREREDEYL